MTLHHRRLHIILVMGLMSMKSVLQRNLEKDLGGLGALCVRSKISEPILERTKSPGISKVEICYQAMVFRIIQWHIEKLG